MMRLPAGSLGLKYMIMAKVKYESGTGLVLTADHKLLEKDDVVGFVYYHENPNLFVVDGLDDRLYVVPLSKLKLKG
jgi:hypothetical protein